MTVRVKICGATTPLSPETLAGVSYLGLNAIPTSPRCLSLEAAHAIAAQVSSSVTIVGVFANQPTALIREWVREVPLGLVQLHGHETPGACRAVGAPFIKAFRADDAARLGREIPEYLDGEDSPFLLDAAVPGVLGGSGARVDWALARTIAETVRGRLFLAGGLTPENVKAAILAVTPWAVDVASGVESAPGIKVPARVQAFVRASRQPLA